MKHLENSITDDFTLQHAISTMRRLQENLDSHRKTERLEGEAKLQANQLSAQLSKAIQQAVWMRN